MKIDKEEEKRMMQKKANIKIQFVTVHRHKDRKRQRDMQKRD